MSLFFICITSHPEHKGIHYANILAIFSFSGNSYHLSLSIPAHSFCLAEGWLRNERNVLRLHYACNCI